MSEAKLSPAIPQLPAAFFRDVLGFEIAEFPEYNFLTVRCGPAEVHFWQTSSEEAARLIAGQSSCYIRVENIRALMLIDVND